MMTPCLQFATATCTCRRLPKVRTVHLFRNGGEIEIKCMSSKAFIRRLVALFKWCLPIRVAAVWQDAEAVVAVAVAPHPFTNSIPLLGAHRHGGRDVVRVGAPAVSRADPVRMQMADAFQQLKKRMRSVANVRSEVRCDARTIAEGETKRERDNGVNK